MEITSSMREIAMMLAKINGERPKVGRYYDENNKSAIDIVTLQNKPNHGEMTYATVGLSNYAIGETAENKSLFIEIIGACTVDCDCFPNILATCAFNIINSQYKCYPGAIFPDVVKMYIPNIEMKHIMFVHPFLWDDELKTLRFEDKEIAWLQAIPISEDEYQFAEKHGVEELESKLEKANIDIFNIARHSAL